MKISVRITSWYFQYYTLLRKDYVTYLEFEFVAIFDSTIMLISHFSHSAFFFSLKSFTSFQSSLPCCKITYGKNLRLCSCYVDVFLSSKSILTEVLQFIFVLLPRLISDAYSEPSRTSTMELFHENI